MDYHHHARLTLVRREELAKRVVEGRLSLKEAGAEFRRKRHYTRRTASHQLGIDTGPMHVTTY